MALLGLLTIVAAVASIPGAIVVALSGCIGIWLRGYLIPFTPRFAPQLVSHLPWNPFHVERASDSIDSVADTDSQGVLRELAEKGVIQITGEELELERSFETAWHAEMDRLTSLSDDELFKETLSVSPAATDGQIQVSDNHTYIVLTNGSGSFSGESWLRWPVAVAETAAALTLREWGVSPNRSAAGARALGLFLQTCPECGGTIIERPAGGCCGPPETGPDGHVLQARVCESCSIRYHVFE